MLTLDDAAKMLDLPPQTILRWAREGKIPASEAEDGRYLFDQKKLLKWSWHHNIFLNRNYQQNGDSRSYKSVPLGSLLRRGGIHYGIPGDSREDILSNGLKLIPLPDTIQRSFVLDLLIQRERLASTGIGRGIAIPHPRHPVQDIPEPGVIAVGFPEHPIDYGAIDGQPVFVLFFLFSITMKSHLHFLARLSHFFHDEQFYGLLKEQAEAKEILARVEQIESSFEQPR